jgi:hypothetical protein
VLIFGESEHDRRAIRHLVVALRPDLDGAAEERRSPLVLIKGALPATARDNAAEIAKLARAEASRRDVLAVLAHQDCDALEPAHERVASKLEDTLRTAGCPNPIAVAPAWEIEAWWLVFPEAVAGVVDGWRSPDDWLGRDVGKVKDAKEALRRAVRPRGKGSQRGRPRDYAERDSIRIAEAIRTAGLLRSFREGVRETPGPGATPRRTRCASLEQVRARILAIPQRT